MDMKFGTAFALYGLLAVLAPGDAVWADELVTLDTRPGVTQSFLLLEPDAEPAGVIVMFPGHEGVARFSSRDGKPGVETERGGFTASEEARTTYLENAMVVALMAAPSDRPDGMDTAFRSSEQHATDIAVVIDYLNRRYRKHPYLHGHCRSSFSPASIATRLNNRGIAGLILSSPRSQGRHGAVTDYAKGVIDVPVLLVQHADDPCTGTPYSGLGRVQKFYESSSQRVDVIVVSGGDTARTGPGSCQNGAHSFRGLQRETASAITHWIRGEEFQTRIREQ